MNMGINFGNLTDPETLKLIFIIFDIFILSGWIVAFLIGMAKGMRKSLRFLIAALPGFLLLIFLIDPVCKLILNVNIGGLVRQIILIVNKYVKISEEVINDLNTITSLKDLIIKGLNELLKGSTAISTDSETYRLIEALIISAVRIFIYYSGIVFNFTVLFPIFRGIIRLIEKAIFGKEALKTKPNIISRLIGGGIMAVAVFVFTAMWALPLSGTVTAISSVEPALTNIVSQYKEYKNSTMPTSETDEEKKGIFIFEDLNIDDDYISFIDKSLMLSRYVNKGVAKNILSFGSTIDVASLNSITKVRTKNGSINYVKAIVKEAKIINKTIVENLNDGYFDYEAFIKNDLTQMIKVFENSSAVAVVAPAAIEIIETQVDLETYGIDKEELAAINWKNETKSLVSVILSVVDFMSEVELDIEEPLKILENENLDDFAANLGASLQSSDLITKIAFGVANKYLQEALRENLQGKVEDIDLALEILDLRNISNGDWANDFKLIANTSRALYGMGVFDAIENEELSIEFKEYPEEIKRIITNIFEISFIKGKEAKLITVAIDASGLKEKLGEAEIDINTICSDIDFAREAGLFADAINGILSLDIDITAEDVETEFKKFLKSENTEIIKGVLGNIFNSTIVARAIPIVITEALKKNSQEAWISDWVLEARKHPENVLPEAYSDEVNIICDILEILSTIDITSEELTIENLLEHHRDELITILEKVVTSKLVNMKASVKYLEEALNSALSIDNEAEKITIEEENIPSNSDEWKKEIEVVKFLLEKIDILTAEDFDMKANEELIHELVNKIFDSKMFASIANKVFIIKVVPIIESTINDMLPDSTKISINDEDIPTTKDEWNNEITVIYKVIDDIELVTAEDFDYTKAENKEVITRIIDSLYDSKILSPHINTIVNGLVIKEIEQVINDSLGTSITINDEDIPTTKELWEKEVEALYDIIECNDLINDASFDTSLEESRAGVVKGIGGINKSSMLKPHLKTILEEMFSICGYECDLTLCEIEKITDWRLEVDALFDLNDAYTDMNSTGYDITTKDNIDALLLDASKGVISSFIIGDIIAEKINEFYGNDALTITEKYDFKDQNTLKENAYPIKALIDFGNCVKTVNTLIEEGSLTDASIASLTDAMKKLDHTPHYSIVDDGIVMMIKYGSGNEAVSITPENIKTVNYLDEAEKLGSALTYYKNGDYASTLNEVKDTILAKEIIISLTA